MKIGLYFGSFNPIHNGHLIVAQQLLEQAGLDKIWFVLSPQNPFKQNSELLHENSRLLILERAIEGNPSFEVCDEEFRLPRPSYTIDTLNHLALKYKEHTFWVIMGSDNLEHFTAWKNYEDILTNFKIIVYSRGAVDEKWEHYKNLLLFDAPYIHISATYIRHLVKQGKSIRYLVPEQVEEEIKKCFE